MTTEQASNGKPRPPACSMALNRLSGVLRAGGMETAIPAKDRAENLLVGANQKQAGVFHNAYPGFGAWLLELCSRLGGTEGAAIEFLSKERSSSRSEANSARATEARGCTMMSHPDGISPLSRRRISRIRLRIRLRTTALPSARPTLIPKRLSPRPLALKNAVNWRLERLWPLR